MDMENNAIEENVLMNDDTMVDSEEKVIIKKSSVKDKVMEDGKLTFLEILYVARYFLPILTTIGWLLVFLLQNTGTPDFVGYIILTLMGIGLVSALTVSPIKLIKFIFKSAIKGFQILRGLIPFYGLADFFAATIGIGVGFLFGAFVVFCLPAVFTIAKFFNEEIFE